jgi:hypothetical protein
MRQTHLPTADPDFCAGTSHGFFVNTTIFFVELLDARQFFPGWEISQF